MSEIITGQAPKSLANFARNTSVADIIAPRAVQVPDIFYWEEEYQGQKTAMTGAFRWKGQLYGLTYPMSEDRVENFRWKKQLGNVLGDTLDLLVHHGSKILDADGNINWKLVNDMEAERFWLDKNWLKQAAAFKRAVRIKEITQAKAKEMGLI